MNGTLSNLVQKTFRVSSISAWILLTVTATVMGPFNTLVLLEPFLRAVYWGGVIFMALLLSPLMAELVALIEHDRLSWRFDILRILAMCVGYTPLVWGWTVALIPNPTSNPPELTTLAMFVGLIGVVVHFSKRILRTEYTGFLKQEDGSVSVALAAVENSTVPEVQPEPLPRLMRRLPDHINGTVLRLSARDHFVDVVFAAETHSIRMRFADAIDEMDGIEGYCAHRSHWVTRDAVSGIERDGARLFLRLSNGDQIPVSRTYRPQLEAAGLL